MVDNFVNIKHNREILQKFSPRFWPSIFFPFACESWLGIYVVKWICINTIYVLTSSGKKYMHIQDGNKFNNI
jgi:hypothetical protein